MHERAPAKAYRRNKLDPDCRQASTSSAATLSTEPRESRASTMFYSLLGTKALLKTISRFRTGRESPNALWLMASFRDPCKSVGYAVQSMATDSFDRYPGAYSCELLEMCFIQNMVERGDDAPAGCHSSGQADRRRKTS